MWEVTLFSLWEKLSPTAFRRSEIRVKIFLDMTAIFMSFLKILFPPVLTAPSEPSVVGVVITKAPGACAEKMSNTVLAAL